MTLRLFVGNQRYSSWSLRPWICLRQAGLAFETVVVRFDDPEFAAKVPSLNKRVPALVDGGIAIHESLAICEYVAEQAPELWPRDRAERALARALANEMHAGFSALRWELPMDVCRNEAPGAWPISERARADVARIEAMWKEALARSGGPFLFGAFGVVDAMYAPVVTRFATYAVKVSPEAQSYADRVRALPAMLEWYRAADAERVAGWHHRAGPHGAPQDHEDAMDFALRWAEAWNRREVETIVGHFAESAVFTSPKALAVTGSPIVRGKTALRAYWTERARAMPAGLRFEVERVELALDDATIAIRYVRRDGERVERACEMLTFDPYAGTITAGEAYYGA